MDKLPVELYRPIIRCLDNKTDIAHLLCCSKLFQRECEPMLYAEIILNGLGSTSQQLFQVTCNPRTAPLTISLTFMALRNLFLNDVPGDGLRTYNTNSPLADRGFLRPALEALPNLKRLKLAAVLSSLYPLIGQVFDDVPFKLHAFSCPYAWDADLVRFLSSQDELRTLEWHGSVFANTLTSPIVPHNILPYLTNIQTDGNIINYLIPGRPVSRVHYNTIQSWVYNLPLLLSQSSVRIEVLVIGLLPTDRDTLESWKDHLSDLRFLECDIGRANQSSIYTILPFLTKLTKLVLHGMGDIDDLSTDESYQLVANALELAPSLCVIEQEVILPPESEEFMEFLHWNRGGGVPHARSQAVDEWLYY